MITNPALSVLNSFNKIKMPKPNDKPKGMGMMNRSRPPIQQNTSTEKQPMIKAKEIQMHIRQARNMQKNGDGDGTIV
tara:strand:- start:319 stop:549 length:231 start_codon:yes stop_codon:yes gene_type:complete